MADLHPYVAFTQGDTWPISGICRDKDGSLLNLTSVSDLRWRLTDQAGTVVLDFTLGGGLTIVDATAGAVLIVVSKEQSDAIAPGSYRDQLRLTLPDGTRSTQWSGSIEVKKSLFT